MSELTEQRLQDIEDRCNKATGGPWYWDFASACGPDSMFGADGEVVIDLACDNCDGRKVESEDD